MTLGSFTKIFGVLLLITAFVVAEAQLSPEALPADDGEPLPRYQIEIIAFAYKDFDPTEEIFEKVLRGSLLDLLAPNLFDTPPPERIDASIVALDMLPEPDFYLPDALAIEPIPVHPEEVSPFEHPRDDPLTTEVEEFTTDPNPADPSDEQPTISELEALDQGWYRLLRSEELKLGNALARLNRLDAYTPLAHGGWIQEGHAEAQAIPFDLSLFGVYNPRGSIRLHVSRFLHVTVDLAFQAPIPNDVLLQAPPGPLAQLEFPPRYALEIQRLVRSGELHFFDHPAFGVLVMVQPAPEAPAIIEEGLAPAA